METTKKYLTTNELGRYLSISRSTVMKWSREGYLPYKRCGRQYRYDIDEINSVVKKGIDLN
jgi:excisionase family DNA binding protein